MKDHSTEDQKPGENPKQKAKPLKSWKRFRAFRRSCPWSVQWEGIYYVKMHSESVFKEGL